MIDLKKPCFDNDICRACYDKQIAKYGNTDGIKCNGITVESDVAFAIKNGLTEHEARWIYDTAYFFERVYKSKPRSYQIPILLCSSRNLVTRQCRQSGKTLAITIKIMHFVHVNDGQTVLIVGPNEKVVKKIYDEYIWRDCINKSVEIRESVRSKTQKPYYQVEFCNDSKVMLMIANESARGQCNIGSSLVQMADGTRKQLIDISIGEKIISFNDSTFKLEEDIVTDKHSNGKKRIIKVKTQSGKSVSTTDNHPYWTQRGWVEATDLTLEDWLSTPNKFDFANMDTLTVDEVKLCAYLIGDGCLTKNGRKQAIRFSVKNDIIKNEFLKICTENNYLFGIKKQKLEDSVTEIQLSSKKDSVHYNLLDRLGLLGKYSYEKYIPVEIQNSSENLLSIFLNRLYSTDGSVSCIKSGGDNQYYIEYVSTSKKLAYNIQYCLQKFGIHSKVTTRQKTECFGIKKLYRKQYRVNIRNKTDVKLFLEKIGFIFGKEDYCKNAMDNILSSSDADNRDNLIPITDLIINKAKEKNINLNSSTKKEAMFSYTKRHVPTKNKVENINKLLCDSEIQKYLDADIRWEKIVSIEECKEEETYNLTIKNNSTFIVDSIITHNTASWLYCDEAAIIPNEMLNSIIMTMASTGEEATLIQTSTPRGRGNLFYKSCNEDPAFNEFHVPIDIIDEMKSQAERFRRILGETGYLQEVMALFPATSGGPFNYSGIDLAKSDYEYEECKYFEGPVYIGGVDWNGPGVGSYFVIIEFNPALFTIKVVERQVVSSANWNSLVAKQTLIDLNRKWKCSHWMVDYGYSASLREELIAYSMQITNQVGNKHPDAKIKYIIDPVEFGALITVDDPFTKEEMKKTTRSFMIGQMARLFEPHSGEVSFSYPSSDDDITESLENYKLLGTTARGYEQYGFAKGDGIEDHLMDALALSVYGVIKYYSELFKKIVYRSVTLNAKETMLSFSIDSDILDLRGRNITLITDDSPESIRDDERKIGDPMQKYESMASKTFGKSGAIKRNLNSDFSNRMFNRGGIIRRTIGR